MQNIKIFDPREIPSDLNELYFYGNSEMNYFSNYYNNECIETQFLSNKINIMAE